MTATAQPRSLREARALVEPALRAAVDQLAPRVRHIAGYHFGWWDFDGVPAKASGGKAVRPALALLGARAAGAPAAVALPGAVAVELVHNFSLLHDDLMDGDRERRHRLTVWAAFGQADAILTGDALMVLADRVLIHNNGPHAIAALRCLSEATQHLIAGQTDDLAFESRLDVTVDEVLAMEAAKTGSLLSCSLAIGAVLAGAPQHSVAALSRFGDAMGAAFQLVDDLLGIWGRPETTGKPVLADIRSRKKSVPVVVALNSGTPSAERLAQLYAAGEWRSDADIALAAELVEDAGGRAWTEAEARRQLAVALAALEHADLDPAAADELAELATYVAARNV